MLQAPNGDPLPRVLTVRQAIQLGYTLGRIRTELRLGRWDELTRGVYFTRGELPTRADWVRAGMELAGAGAALSGWDAVRAYGLGSDRPPSDEVLVLAVGGTHRLRGRVRIRPSRRPTHATRRLLPGAGRIPVAGVARAVADTALVYRTFAPVRALVISAAQQGLCTAEALARELDDGPRNGSGHLRRALEDVLIGAASVPEAELADLMRGAGLPEFELNVPLVDYRGVVIAVADVLWRELRAVLEVDSRKHHFLETEWRGTMRRHNELTRCGLALTHYPPVELRDNRERVLGEIDQWLRARSAELRLPYPPPPAPDRGTPFRLDRL